MENSKMMFDQNSWFCLHGDRHDDDDHDHDHGKSLSLSSSSTDDDNSTVSTLCSSWETADDESSSSSSRALFDMSEIMEHLPIKKGLSKFYAGKSESFTSLSSVTSVEDLVKKAAVPCSRKVGKASSRSCRTSLHLYRPYTLSNPNPTKKPAAADKRCSQLVKDFMDSL